LGEVAEIHRRGGETGPEPSRLELRLLGGFAVAVDGVPVPDSSWARRKPQLLVKLLALQPRHRLHREQIVDLLWPRLDPESAARQLHKAVHQVRRALEPGLAPRAESRFLRTDGQELILRAPAALWVDADEFEREATRALRGDDVGAGEAALALYGGDLLPGELYEEWASERRERLNVLRQRLLMHLAGLCAASGRLGRGVELLSELIACDAADEDAHRELMLLYARAGDRHRALRQYRDCVEALRRELDVEPLAGTVELYAEILSGRVAAAERPTQNAAPRTVEAAPEPATATAPEPPRAPSVLHVALPRARARRRAPAVVTAAAALTILLGPAAMLAPGLPWSARLRHKVDRAVAKAEMRVAGLMGAEPRLLSVMGRLDVPGGRVEALDSISGWAAYADRDGGFVVPDLAWYPGARYELVVSREDGSAMRVSVVAPRAFPDGGLLDVGELAFTPAEGGLAEVYGFNSVSFVDFDERERVYYEGVFDAVAARRATDEEKVDAVFRFVASLRPARDLTGPGLSPREVLTGGSGRSGDLSLALATIARAGGYEVRLVNVVAGPGGRNAHMVAEVFYGGGWHLYDPTCGIAARGAGGAVASYGDLRRDRGALARASGAPEWLAAAYASGIHHYYYFRGPSGAAPQPALACRL
jgi:DNA-binding SARP family transcriptional activator